MPDEPRDAASAEAREPSGAGARSGAEPASGAAPAAEAGDDGIELSAASIGAAAPEKRGFASEVGFSLQSIAMAVALFVVLAFGLPWLIGLVWK